MSRVNFLPTRCTPCKTIRYNCCKSCLHAEKNWWTLIHDYDIIWCRYKLHMMHWSRRCRQWVRYDITKEEALYNQDRRDLVQLAKDLSK